MGSAAPVAGHGGVFAVGGVDRAAAVAALLRAGLGRAVAVGAGGLARCDGDAADEHEQHGEARELQRRVHTATAS
jgi:hypothetical protein